MPSINLSNASAIIWRKGVVKDGHIYRLPVQGELMAMSGVVVGAAAFPQFFLAFIAAYSTVWAVSSALKTSPGLRFTHCVVEVVIPSDIFFCKS